MQHPLEDTLRRTLCKGAVALAVLGSITTGTVLIATIDQPVAVAQPDIPCEQWQQMHPGWPCIPVPKPPPGPPPGTPGGPGGPPTTAQPAPTPALPGQAPNLSGTGGRAGALTPPPAGPGNGTPIVPVPGQEPVPQPQLAEPAEPNRPEADLPPTSNPPQTPPPISPLPQQPLPVASRDPGAPADATQTSARAEPRGSVSPLTWLLLPLLLAVAAGGVAVGRRSVRDKDSPSVQPSTFDGLPGLPPPVAPVPPGTPVLTSRFDITRLYPGVYAPPGLSSRDFNDNPGVQGVYGPNSGPYSGYGTPIRIDPDTTPGAVGPWSGNVLQPDPITGKTGISIPTGGNGPNPTNNSLDLDITKKVQLRIVGLKPMMVSSFDYNGQPTLAVTYEPMYQVRDLYYGWGTGIVGQPGKWTDITLEDVKTLERMGAFVPVVPARQ